MGLHESGKWGRVSNPMDRMGDKRKNPNPSGYNAYQGATKAWCYVCGSEHRYGEPCRDGTVFRQRE